MRRVVLCCVVALLVVLPGRPARADVVRPTAAEVAAGVMACLQESAGRPLTIGGHSGRAAIDAGGSPAFVVWRGQPAERYLGTAQHVMEGDPLDPPMLLGTPYTAPLATPRGEPWPLTPQAVACFDQEYRRLLDARDPA